MMPKSAAPCLYSASTVVPRATREYRIESGIVWTVPQRDPQGSLPQQTNRNELHCYEPLNCLVPNTAVHSLALKQKALSA